MKIEGKCVVSIDYKLRDEAGEILDASGSGDPLVYLHGVGALVSGLENELTGKSKGDNIRVKVAPSEGYGEVMPQLIQKLPRETFQGVENVEVGMEFEATGEGGHIMVVRVEKIEGDEITINGNHPLAGMTLDFEVGVTDVREASEEELEHGHVHGAGGHHH